MRSHQKHSWLTWDENLVVKHDEDRGNTVFRFNDSEYDDVAERGFIVVSNDKRLFLEDEKVFAATFESETMLQKSPSIGVYDKHGRLLIHIRDANMEYITTGRL